jgi:hypothetical protein
MRSKPTRNLPPSSPRASRSKVPVNKGHLARAKLMLGCAIDSIHEVDSTPHRDTSESFTPHVRTKLPQKLHLRTDPWFGSSRRTLRGLNFTPYTQIKLPQGSIPKNRSLLWPFLDTLCLVSTSLRTPREASPRFCSEEQILWLGYSGQTLFGSLKVPTIPRFATWRRSTLQINILSSPQWNKFRWFEPF